MPVTQQYLCGELASLLGRLEGVAAGREPHCAMHQVRREAECAPPHALGVVAKRAMQLADSLCWDALEHGDAVTFVGAAVIAADLREFAICARLLEA